MMGVSLWIWAWMGVLAPCLWFARAVIWAFLVDRTIRTAVEKAAVEDLPEVLTGLSVLTAALCSYSRPAVRATVSGETTNNDAEIREGGSVR